MICVNDVTGAYAVLAISAILLAVEVVDLYKAIHAKRLVRGLFSVVALVLLAYFVCITTARLMYLNIPKHKLDVFDIDVTAQAQ